MKSELASRRVDTFLRDNTFSNLTDRGIVCVGLGLEIYENRGLWPCERRANHSETLVESPAGALRTSQRRVTCAGGRGGVEWSEKGTT